MRFILLFSLLQLLALGCKPNGNTVNIPRVSAVFDSTSVGRGRRSIPCKRLSRVS